MTPLAPSLEFLSELVGGSDGLIRLAVGAAGAAVGMAGARLYHVTLAVGGFLVGCLGTLALVGDSLDPRTALGLSLVIGVLLSAWRSWAAGSGLVRRPSSGPPRPRQCRNGRLGWVAPSVWRWPLGSSKLHSP